MTRSPATPARIVKVILQGDGNIMLQARVAEMALAAGPPKIFHRHLFRVYESDPPGHSFVAYYNKASITIHPQPIEDARQRPGSA